MKQYKTSQEFPVFLLLEASNRRRVIFFLYNFFCLNRNHLSASTLAKSPVYDRRSFGTSVNRNSTQDERERERERKIGRLYTYRYIERERDIGLKRLARPSEQVISSDRSVIVVSCLHVR